MNTYSAKPTDIERKWYVLDASSDSLGRISTAAAKLLIGKGKPQFTKHIDCGDFVIITNAKNLVVTGKKIEDKKYYRHTGFPGGIKETALKDMEFAAAIRKSVRGMLPVNKLRDARLARLKIYEGKDHNHAAQQPVEYVIKDNK